MSVVEMPKVGGAVGAVVEFFRKRGAVTRAGKQMQVIETLVIGPKQRVVLLQCGAQKFLVGAGADGVQTIVRVDEVAA